MTYVEQLFAVKIPYVEIIKFCQRWKVKQFYLFGSVLRDDFTSESDIDVMVEFFPDANVGWEIMTMNDELETIFNRQVDLTTKQAIEESDNWLLPRKAGGRRQGAEGMSFIPSPSRIQAPRTTCGLEETRTAEMFEETSNIASSSSLASSSFKTEWVWWGYKGGMPSSQALEFNSSVPSDLFQTSDLLPPAFIAQRLLPSFDNWLRRQNILSSALSIYEQKE